MNVQEISVDQLADLMASGARLVDVREVAEYEGGHVPGAELVPLADIPQRADSLRSPGPVYIICRSGSRSMAACEFLVAQGIEAVNVAGGTMAWARAGHEVTVSST